MPPSSSYSSATSLLLVSRTLHLPNLREKILPPTHPSPRPEVFLQWEHTLPRVWVRLVQSGGPGPQEVLTTDSLNE